MPKDETHKDIHFIPNYDSHVWTCDMESSNPKEHFIAWSRSHSYIRSETLDLFNTLPAKYGLEHLEGGPRTFPK